MGSIGMWEKYNSFNLWSSLNTFDASWMYATSFFFCCWMSINSCAAWTSADCICCSSWTNSIVPAKWTCSDFFSAATSKCCSVGRVALCCPYNRAMRLPWVGLVDYSFTCWKHFEIKCDPVLFRLSSAPHLRYKFSLNIITSVLRGTNSDWK